MSEVIHKGMVNELADAKRVASEAKAEVAGHLGKIAELESKLAALASPVDIGGLEAKFDAFFQTLFAHVMDIKQSIGGIVPAPAPFKPEVSVTPEVKAEVVPAVSPAVIRQEVSGG